MTDLSREAKIQAEANDVFKAMNAASVGHTLEAVEQGAANMLISAIISGATLRKVSDEDFKKYCRAMVETVFRVAVTNWEKSRPTVEVSLPGEIQAEAAKRADA